MSDKIVAFPKHKIVREVPANVEEIEKAKERSTQNFAEDIMEDLISNIYAELENYGLNVDNEHFEKDFSFAADALRSTIYRTLGIKHPMQEFIETSVTMTFFDRKGLKTGNIGQEYDPVSETED
jgi:hypothetical protein